MRRIAVIAAVAALALAGCGGDDEPSSDSGTSGAPAASDTPAASGGGATLQIAADPDGATKFTETALTAEAGKVTVEFSNPSQLPHAVEIEGNGVEEETETVTGKDAPALTVDLKAGEYTFYCPVGDHRAEGMEGKLTVG
jgi:plastocyanin